MAAKLDDHELQLKFLRLISEGKPRGKAAKRCGISSETVRRYMRANPDFEEEVLTAEEDAFDDVEKTIRQMARAGDISAAKLYEQMKRKRDTAARRQLVIDHQQTIAISATDQARELVQLLRQRKELSHAVEGDVIEGEVVG